ncbi:MAG: hypothetical protein ACI308_01175 [Muribaculaceae bacterium]
MKPLKYSNAMERFSDERMKQLMTDYFNIYNPKKIYNLDSLSIFYMFKAKEALRIEGDSPVLTLFDMIIDFIGIDKIRSLKYIDVHIEIGPNSVWTFEECYVLSNMINLISADLDFRVNCFNDAKIDSAFRVTVFTFE